MRRCGRTRAGPQFDALRARMHWLRSRMERWQQILRLPMVRRALQQRTFGSREMSVTLPESCGTLSASVGLLRYPLRTAYRNRVAHHSLTRRIPAVRLHNVPDSKIQFDNIGHHAAFLRPRDGVAGLAKASCPVSYYRRSSCVGDPYWHRGVLLMSSRELVVQRKGHPKRDEYFGQVPLAGVLNKNTLSLGGLARRTQRDK